MKHVEKSMGNMDIDVRVQRVQSSRTSTWAKTLKIVYSLYFKSLTLIYNFLWLKSCARKTIFPEGIAYKHTLLTVTLGKEGRYRVYYADIDRRRHSPSPSPSKIPEGWRMV